MLMADDGSDVWSFEDLSVADDNIDLSIDLQSLWEILGESPSPNPLQNSPENLSVAKQQKGESASDVGNDEHSLLRTGSTELKRESLFGPEFAGSFTFSSSYNSDVSDYRAGASDGSFESAGNSVIVECGNQEASAFAGSPVHGSSRSLANRMLPVSDQDGSQYPFSEKFDINYGKYFGSSENNFNTLGTPEIVEASMMDLDISMPWDLHDSLNLSFMSNSDQTLANIKDELEDHPSETSTTNGATAPETQLGRARGAFFVDPDVSGINIKCEANNIISPTSGNSFPRIEHMPLSDKPSSQLLSATMSNADNKNHVVHLENDINDKLVLPQGMPSASIDSTDVTLRSKSPGVGDGFPAVKCSRQLLSPTLQSNSINNLSAHVKNERDLFLASKRARHTLGNIDETACKNSNLPHLDVQASDMPCTQPSTLMRKQLGCMKDGRERELIQPKSMDTHISNVGCQTMQNNITVNGSHIDDDSDICILEDISEPSRSSLSSMNRKSLVISQHSTFNSPLNHMGMGGVRFKADDERLIFRVVLQDLSQPKTEASPPDGVLAVPLLRHQRIALSWMVQKETASLHCSGGILADDQGLGKTVSTIALILKERAPSSRACTDNLRPNKMETLNLDEDDDCLSELDRSKQDVESCKVVSDGASIKSRDASFQSKGRPAAGTLVVCPTSVLRQWAEELHNKVTSKADLSVLVYHGSNRTKDPSELAKYDVVLTTYSIVSMEVPKQPLVDKDDEEAGRQEDGGVLPVGFSSSRKRKYPPSSGKRSLKDKKGMDNGLLESAARPLARVGWFRVVLDEAQSIKNHRTQVARACWGLRAKRRWCLSGTPIQNAVDDLYSYFRFLRYDPYAVYKSFCSTIKVPINRNPTNGYKKLQAVLKTIMLRRTKGTLLDGEPIINLPPKSIELKKVDFTKEERDFYCRLEADSRAQFAEYAAAGTVKQNYVNILLMLLRLRQACDHPLLVRGYDSSSAWRSSVETAKKLPHEKKVCLLNCLEASLAICRICNDPPEDAVVTSCGHVFCNQCICEHLTGDDNQCPTTNCNARLSVSSVFSRAALKCSLSDHPGQDSPPGCFGSEVPEKPEPGSWSPSFDSSKIKAALEVLQSLSKPGNRMPRSSTWKFIDESAPCPENLSDPLSSGLEREIFDNRNLDLDKCSNGLIKVAGEKAIVFSQWTRMLDLLENCLKNSSIQYRRLDGTMSVVARDRAVKDFNSLPEVSVMIMSLKAASLGLNMVAACHVLLLDLWWNPTTEDQAVDRAHRIGQTRPVTVLRLTVKDTVEDRILALQQKKREMVASAFGEDETGSRQTRLTVEDLKYLFMA